MNSDATEKMEIEYIKRHHRHELMKNQCSSILVKHIKAPLHLVWSLVRRFDQPQKYKPFISKCVVRGKSLEIGTVREVDVKSGLPATKALKDWSFSMTLNTSSVSESSVEITDLRTIHPSFRCIRRQ